MYVQQLGISSVVRCRFILTVYPGVNVVMIWPVFTPAIAVKGHGWAQLLPCRAAIIRTQTGSACSPPVNLIKLFP